MKGWITDEELLKRGAESQAPVSPRQLERWRKDGLLQRSVQRHVPGHRGSVSLCPPESVNQLVALSRLHQKERRLGELRFLLWWEGQWADCPKLGATIADALRKFGAKLSSYTEAARRAAEKEESDPDLVPAVAAERIATNLTEKSRSPLLRFMRRNLRRRKPDVLSAVMVLAQVVMGISPLYGDALDDLGEMTPEKSLFQAAGLTPATQTGPGGIPPWIPDGASSVPRALAQIKEVGIADISRLAQFVEEATDDELDQARDAARFLVEDMPTFVRGFGVLFGRNVMGLGAFRHFDRISITEKMLMIPLLIALNKRFGTQWLTTFRADVRKFRYMAEALVALAAAFPHYKRYFSVEMAEKLAVLPEKERARIMMDIGEYLKRHHPEVFKGTT
jgi:hypothetical protein